MFLHAPMAIPFYSSLPFLTLIFGEVLTKPAFKENFGVRAPPA